MEGDGAAWTFPRHTNVIFFVADEAMFLHCTLANRTLSRSTHVQLWED